MVNINSLGLSTIGIDVSKNTLDVYVLPQGEHFSIENTAKEIRQLLPKLPNIKSIKMVAFEPTNRYEKCVRDILFSRGYPVHIAHTSHVYYYGQSLKGFGKTDKIDAEMIANYAKQDHLKQTPIPDKQTELLEEFTSRRRQLINMQSAEASRLAGNLESQVERSIKRFMKQIAAEIKLIDAEMNKIIKKNEALADRKALLSTFKGVGEVTSTVLVACLPELGTLSRSQIAALTGLAPYNADSGSKQGTRRIRGGRSYIRSMLFMCSLSAIQFNPALSAYYKKLVAKGKKKRVAQVAVMRKMIITLNAIVRDNKIWDPEF